VTKEKKIRYDNVSSDFLPTSSKSKTTHDFQVVKFQIYPIFKKEKKKKVAFFARCVEIFFFLEGKKAQCHESSGIIFLGDFRGNWAVILP